MVEKIHFRNKVVEFYFGVLKSYGWSQKTQLEIRSNGAGVILATRTFCQNIFELGFIQKRF